LEEIANILGRYIDFAVTFFALVGSVILFHRKAVAPTLRKVEALSDLLTEQMKENDGGNLIDKVNRIPVIEDELRQLKLRLEKDTR